MYEFNFFYKFQNSNTNGSYFFEYLTAKSGKVPDVCYTSHQKYQVLSINSTCFYHFRFSIKNVQLLCNNRYSLSSLLVKYQKN